MGKRPVVLFQPPNRVGLGHINRLCAIALALREIDPEVRVPFVVEGASHDLVEAHGLPHLDFPSRHELYKSGRWEAWAVEERSRLAVSIAKAIIQKLQADLVVFDCFPCENLAAAAIECRIPMALCLRKGRNWDQYLNIRRVQLVLPHLRLVIDELVERAEADTAFRAALIADLESAVAGEGVEPTERIIRELRTRLS